MIGTLSGDRTAPKLDFTYAVASVSYSDKNPLTPSAFLNGVTAVDSKDGDLTPDIYVSSMDYGADGKTLTIVYGVKDYNGNITTAKSVYNLNGNVATIFEAVPDKPSETEPAVVETTTEDKTEATTEESTTEEVTEEPSTEETTEVIPSVEPSSEVIPPVESQPDESSSEVIVDTTEYIPEETVNDAAPVLILSQDELTLPAGSPRVNFNDYIAQLYDDVDDYYYLFTTIWVENEGNVDFNTPGEYYVIYHAKDSDGNWSVPQIMRVYIV